LEKADATVLDIDEVVRAEVDAKLADKARGLIGKIDDAAADLNEAADLVSKAQPGLNDVDRKRAKATKAAIDERLTMLGVANAILDANAKAGVALDPATKGWDTMLEGDRLADAAVVEYNKLTKAGVSASTSLTADAEAKIRAGRALMSEAATAFPEAGLKLYVEYADGKLALLATSKKSNAAWLLGDITSANKLISQYNADEKTVIVIAKRLPESPARAVADAYQKLAGAATDTYFEARERATKADATLKDM
ncbi:MAG: hypothetical protein Q8K89_00910, partial [Actinomycetota bacterium]|nr:hypothetical protein [Actinomycetota bacterium]